MARISFEQYPGGVLPAVQTRSERLHGVRKNSAHYARNHAVSLAVDRPATSGGAYSHGCTQMSSAFLRVALLISQYW